MAARGTARWPDDGATQPALVGFAPRTIRRVGGGRRQQPTVTERVPIDTQRRRAKSTKSPGPHGRLWLGLWQLSGLRESTACNGASHAPPRGLTPARQAAFAGRRHDHAIPPDLEDRIACIDRALYEPCCSLQFTSYVFYHGACAGATAYYAQARVGLDGVTQRAFPRNDRKRMQRCVCRSAKCWRVARTC